MDIKNIELVCNSGKEIMREENGLYTKNDVKVEEKNGKISIYAETSEMYFVRIHIENTYFKNAYIMGDALERAYGDLEWKKMNNTAMPWYFIANENGKNYCFGVKTQPNAICSWECNADEIILNVDIRNGNKHIVLGGRTLDACEIVIAEFDGDEYSAAQEFCAMMCEKAHAEARPIYGGNDWYCNYGDNSYDKIMEHAKRIVECSPKGGAKPYMVIDDGWEICHHQSPNDYEYYNGGPWKYCNRNFGDMKKIAEDIEKAGAVPGIWFRPLWTVEKVPEECILKHDGIKYTFDPSSEIALKQVAEDVATIKSWGYKLIKHDFTSFDIFGQYGFEMKDDIYKGEIVFADKTKTTAEIIKNLYMTIREAAGEDVLIMGCNTVSHLSAGIFDIQRTGDDTSGFEWERTRKMGINTLAFRMCQHNRFYMVDADCVGITNEISWERNKKWLDVLAKSGTPLFVSIAEDAYTDEIKNDIKSAFEKAAKNTITSKPLDWTSTKTPQKWESDFGIDEYDWN